jgi:transposase
VLHPDASPSSTQSSVASSDSEHAESAADASTAKATTFAAPGALPMPRELLSAGVVLDQELEMERQLRMETLKAELMRQMTAGNGALAVDQLLARLVDLERENERLAWRVLLANRYRFGCSTEKLSRDELRQLYLAFGGDAAVAPGDGELPVPAPQEPEQIAPGEPSAPDAGAEASPAAGGESAQPEKTKKKRQRVRSMRISDSVERKVTTVPVPEEERQCALCGADKQVFGHVEHQLFTFVPAKIVVHVEQREKLSCKACRKDVSVAPRSEAPSVVRKVDASLLSKLVSEKCSLALPLDRQRRELARLGLEVPDKTIASYWAYTTDLIEPVATATLSLALTSSLVGADDTHLKTLDKSSKHGAFRGHIWCFVGTTGTVGGPETVAYGYTPSWEATEIVDWFSAIDGFIQCDDYAGYSREIELEDDGHEKKKTFVAVPPERRLGCGMHIRSKFHAALLAKDKRAAIPLQHFSTLYAIEEDCKARGLDADARGEERRRRSLSVLDTLDDWVDAIHPKLLPKSPLRRATTYAINQREFFRRCFSDGRFEIDNGRVERRIRPFAVARRNFLFTGSVRGGERLAAAFTLVDSCLLLGVDPYAYLVDVIRKLEAGWPLRRLSELIPQRWAAEQAAQQRPQ